MSDYLFMLPISLFLLMGVISPGPSFLLVAQTAMGKSRSEGIAVSIGMGMGAAVFAMIASIGLFVLLEAVPWVYFILKSVGGLYLCFLAYKMWFDAKTSADAKSQGILLNRGVAKMLFVGLSTQVSNPKTAIVFGSAFAAFLPDNVPNYSYVLICALAFMIDTIWYMFVAMLLSTQKAQDTYARFKKIISRIASGFMGFMGVKLLVNEF